MYSIEQPFATLKISGKNKLKFLQNLTTCNIHQLSDYHGLPSCFCNYKGKVIAFGFFSQHQTDIYFHTTHSTSKQLLEHLTPFAKLERITLTLNPSERICMGIISEKPLYLLNETNQAVCPTPTFTIGCIGITPYTYLVHGPKERILNWANTQHLSPTFEPTWISTLIYHQWPIIEQENTLKFTPNMLNLVPSSSVSISKGCYLGQEIIARSHHLGQTKRTLTTFRLDHFEGKMPNIGDELLCQNSSCQSAIVTQAQCSEHKTLWLQLIAPKGPNKQTFQPIIEGISTQQPIAYEHKKASSITMPNDKT